jgi:hypothetical protein
MPSKDTVLFIAGYTYSCADILSVLVNYKLTASSRGCACATFSGLFDRGPGDNTDGMTFKTDLTLEMAQASLTEQAMRFEP